MVVLTLIELQCVNLVALFCARINLLHHRSQCVKLRAVDGGNRARVAVILFVERVEGAADAIEVVTPASVGQHLWQYGVVGEAATHNLAHRADDIAGAVAELVC